MPDSHTITTADGLARLYKELIDGGIPMDLAADIVREAARSDISINGFCVLATSAVAA